MLLSMPHQDGARHGIFTSQPGTYVWETARAQVHGLISREKQHSFSRYVSPDARLPLPDDRERGRAPRRLLERAILHTAAPRSAAIHPKARGWSGRTGASRRERRDEPKSQPGVAES